MHQITSSCFNREEGAQVQVRAAQGGHRPQAPAPCKPGASEAGETTGLIRSNSHVKFRVTQVCSISSAFFVLQSPTTTTPSEQHADVRVPPSLASGGIPEPSTEYLAQTFRPSTLLPSPRRILVIIDLNGTLLHRPSRKRPSHFVERPHARDFLAYCLDTFYVVIWSSARPDNVRNMVNQLLSPAQVQRCVLVWARDTFGLAPADYDSRVQCYKRLTRVWADEGLQGTHPAAATGGKWDQTNTVLVDDSLEKGRSEPFNILSVPEFSGNEGLDVLPQVHDYLNALCYRSDISSYMRQSQFKLNPDYVLPQPPT